MPSRKVISIFIIASSLIFVVIFTSSSKNKEKPSSTLSVTPDKVEVLATENSDWESEVQKFSLKNAEVVKEESNNVTERFSQAFLANYLSMKQGGTFDGTAALNLVDKSTKFIQGNSTTSNLTIRDIIVSPNNSKEAIQKYGNDLGWALKSNKPEAGALNELEIIKAVVEVGDASKAEELKLVATIYQTIAKALTKIIVPSNFAARHLDMVNTMNNLGFSLLEIAQYAEDPLKAINGVNVYSANFDILTKTINSVPMDLLKAGAIYKQGDNGYFLYFGI